MDAANTSSVLAVRSFPESETAIEVLDDGVVCRRRDWEHSLKTVARMGTTRGGEFVDGIYFRYQGGQVRSLSSLLSFVGSGQYQERYQAVEVPPTKIRRYQLDEARKFADDLGVRLVAATHGN
jgi:hypothetical protein